MEAFNNKINLLNDASGFVKFVINNNEVVVFSIQIV
jgi:hypothetical protein